MATEKNVGFSDCPWKAKKSLHLLYNSAHVKCNLVVESKNDFF